MTDTLAAQIEAAMEAERVAYAELTEAGIAQDIPRTQQALGPWKDAMFARSRLVEANIPAIVTALRQAERNVPNLNSYIDGYEDAQETIRDAMLDSQYLAGAKAGWNAAQDLNPEAAFEALQKSREGHLAGFADAKATIRQAEAAPGVVEQCASCDGTGADLYDGTEHDCQVCSGRGTIALARQHGAREQWQPIESAPSAEGAEQDRILVIGGIYEKPEMVLPDGEWWRKRKAEGGNVFTHWMPLPAAPATDVGEDEIIFLYDPTAPMSPEDRELF